MNDIVFIGTSDPERTKPIKIKNQSNNMHDLKYLIYLNSKNRKYVFSANARSDLNMWMQGFTAFQQIKTYYLKFSGHSMASERIIARGKTEVRKDHFTKDDRQDSVNLMKRKSL